MHLSVKFQDADCLPPILKTPLRTLGERVFLLETVRLRDLNCKLDERYLLGAFNNMSLAERRSVLAVDLADATAYVASHSPTNRRQIYRQLTYLPDPVVPAPLPARVAAPMSDMDMD